MSQELVFQLGLSLIKGVGPVTAKKLIAYCGGPEAVFKEEISNLKKIPTIGSALANEIQNPTVLKRAQEEINYIDKHKIEVLSFWDSHYPYQLKQCVDAPILLFSKGKIEWNDKPIISVVGTRKASAYGLSVCKELMKDLSQFSPTIVSGLAYGIDSYAHKEALKNDIQTIGVLAHGLDNIYPKSNAKLAREMTQNGGLLTEFFLATIDPNGNPTNGITRTATTTQTFLEGFDMTDPYDDAMHSMKSPNTGGKLGWPNDKYINIWVYDITINGHVNLLGYATPPNNLPNWQGDPPTSANEDGVVIHYELFGRDATVNMGAPVAFLGRVTTHEMGHYLGLRHIWGDGLCDMDDGIDYTPFSSTNGQNSCNHNQNTCMDSPYNFPDMVENFMDYSSPECQNIFTKGQMGLMHGVLANQRIDLPVQTVGLKSYNHANFHLYPNPAKDLIHIKFDVAENQSKLQLIDVSGKIIWKKELNSNELETLQLSTINFARGIYFLQYQTESNMNNVKKVILY
tara:strand:+ start:7105 stop:8643 length:1539 start_codon:yes stop_codon:yes gene_type:complete